MRPHFACAMLVVAGCVSSAQTTPNYGDEYAGTSSGPDDPNFDSQGWGGPPGGAMDPGWGYEYPGTDEAALYGGDAYGQPAEGDPNGGGGTWAGATADVTDAEIDTTLQPYGEWVTDADYGNVWRPYTTVVGADFTPYESCGSWVFTEYGWTFQSCNEWSWGWLPFHYGRWVYLDNSWCWSRDYSWGPAWVEWRHGNDYVGWRPLRPTRQIRDHRDRDRGPQIRDHRRGTNERWRFAHQSDFGKRPLRDSPAIDVRAGLAATTSVTQPPMRGETRSRASTLMSSRMRNAARAPVRGGTMGQSTRGSSWTRQPQSGQNAWNAQPYDRRDAPTWQRNRAQQQRQWNRGDYQRPNSVTQPTRPTNNAWNGGYTGGYQRPQQPANAWGGGYSRPNRGGYTPQPGTPSSNYTRPAQPSRPSYTPPARNNFNGNRGTYSPPSRTYSPPSRPSYSPPSRPSAPSRSNYSAPSRSSYSAPSRSSGSSYSAPSRSSSSSSRSSSSSSSSRGSSSGGSRGGRSR